MKRILCILLASLLLLCSGFQPAYARSEKGNAHLMNHQQKDMKWLKGQLKQYYKDNEKRLELLKLIAELRRENNDLSIPVFINGEDISSDVPPVIKYNRVLIPVRAVVNGLGAEVAWDGETYTATITKGEIIIKMNLASGKVTVNGREIELEVPPQLENNRVFVPLRFIAEIFNMHVSWDSDTGSVIIDDGDGDDDGDDNDDNNGQDPGTPGTIPLGSKYEAESAILSGGAALDTSHTGYSGSGFVSGFWNVGASAAFTVNVANAATYNISIRYSNATGSAKNLSLFVNGVKRGQISLQALPNWSTWGTAVTSAALTAGINTITLLYDNGDSGYVNIDYITVSQTASGLISSSVSALQGTVGLSTEGQLDWIHWGLNNVTGVNRKSGVNAQISNYSKIGSFTPVWFPASPASFSWSGGTPTYSAAATPTGIFAAGQGNGFLITAPADTTQKTLKLYLGAWKSKGRVEAMLSDNSAAAATLYIDSQQGTSCKTVTLNYKAGSQGQLLIVKYILDTPYDSGYGNVILHAAALK